MSKKFTPRPYQRILIDHMLAHDRCCAWAGMGMGKTVSTLTALDAMLFLGEGPALVVAPLRVAMSTWPEEAKKWDHLKGLRVSVVCGDKRTKEKALAQKADVYCTNFEQLPYLVEKFGKKWPFRIVVVDEATRLKGFRLRGGSSRAKALARVYSLIDRFIELTGTPAPNGLIDLWGQMWFIDKGKRLGESMSSYETRYFQPIRTGGEAYMVKWVPLPGSADRIKKAVADVTVTVNAEDYFDIEQPIFARREVDIGPRAMAIYKRLETDFYTVLGDGVEVEAVNAQSVLGKCLQVAGGAIYYDDEEPNDPETPLVEVAGRNYYPIHMAKLEALRSVIEEAAGAPVLVSYQFKHEADRILRAFPQARLLDKNPQTIRDWNAGEIPILLAHPAACGHGLNLQDGGNILCFFSIGWNYEFYAQIIERIGPTRQAQSGHPRPVFVYSLVATDTVEMAVEAALRNKESVLDALLEKKRCID